MNETLSVVIPTFNGAQRMSTVLGAVRRQLRPVDEMVVVDDGSSDDSSAVAQAWGARVIRHDRNRGASAARNTGLGVCRSSVVAFLDDDCEPMPEWSGQLLDHYTPEVAAVGGDVIPEARNRYVRRYLIRHNPLLPLEADLARSRHPLFRLWLYARRQVVGPSTADRERIVYAFAGANMSFRRDALEAVGGFDPSLYYGGEDTDLCRRVVAAQGRESLLYVPAAAIVHHFDSSPRRLVRRWWTYGRASAWLYLRDSAGAPTFFPAPTLVLVASVALLRAGRPWVAAALPLIAYPRSILWAFRKAELDSVVDAYVQLIEEAADNVGFLFGIAGSGRHRAEVEIAERKKDDLIRKNRQADS